MNKSLRVLIIVLLIVCIAVFLFAGYKLISKQFEYKEAETFYNNLTQQYISNQPSSSASSSTSAASASAENTVVLDDEVSPISTDWQKLTSDYPDIVAWIYSPETVINYPIAKYDDNQYYLNRQLDGSYNSSGTIFMEVLNQKDFTDDNTLIYGHHMNDGSMFAKLVDYAYQSYYDEHPVMYINTPKYNYRVELFAAFVTDSNSEVYTITLGDENEAKGFIERMKASSKFKSDVEVKPGDKIVTLSTCTYDYDDARFVVLGKLVPIH